MTTKQTSRKTSNRKPAAVAASPRSMSTSPGRSRRASTAKLAKLSSFNAARYLDSEAAVAEFIDAALETGDPAVLIRALGEVARAQGMARVAKLSGLGRESLYKALQPSSHPRLETILRVARALGIRLHASSA
jgi:probable addiction module antidote protein